METVSGRFAAFLAESDGEIREGVGEIGRDRRNSGSGKREAGGGFCRDVGDGRGCGAAGAGDFGTGDGSGLTEIIEDISEIGEIDVGCAVHVAVGPVGGGFAEVVKDNGEVGEVDAAVDVGVSEENGGGGGHGCKGGETWPVDGANAVEILSGERGGGVEESIGAICKIGENGPVDAVGGAINFDFRFGGGMKRPIQLNAVAGARACQIGRRTEERGVGSEIGTAQTVDCDGAFSKRG